MNAFRNIYYWFRHLNIDVGLAAVASSIMAFKVLNVNIHFSFWIVLFFATWSIYTSDHIIDGIKENKTKKTSRYTFYFEHRKKLLPIIVLLGAFNAFLVWHYLNLQIIYGALIMGALTLIYILHIQQIIPKIPLYKDIFSSLLFTIGIWIFPLFMHQGIPSFNQSEIIALFFMAVLLNILMYSINDKKLDKDHSYQTLIIKKGNKLVFSFIKTLFVSSLLVFILLLQSHQKMIISGAIVLSIIQLFHLIVLIKQSYFFEKERFFKIGNLIFILPIILFFF